MIKLKHLLETTLKTNRGSIIRRFKDRVGKKVGTSLYVHKLYANEVIPKNILQKAENILTRSNPNFAYNSIMFDPQKGIIRFDEAPDFDTASEPTVGNYITVFLNGSNTPPKKGYSDNVWHHKWLWIKDDYTGFDVNKSKEWSRQWLSKLNEPAKGSKFHWQSQLKNAGLINESNNDDDDEKIDVDRLMWQDSYLDDIAEKFGYEDNFNEMFWKFPQTLYHCTPEENKDSIIKYGIGMKNKTRGFSSNRHIGAAIFTTSEEGEVSSLQNSYGPVVFSINTPQMKKDNYIPTVEQEPDWAKSEKISFVLKKLGYSEEETESSRFVDSSEGTSPYTVIVYGQIPSKYLSIYD